MAPIGGAPPVGSSNSFTGTSQTLELVGDFAYAYSGTYPADGNSHSVFSFTTGNFVFVGKFKVNGALNPLSGSVANANGEIKIGGATIGVGPMNTALDNNYFFEQDIIIPPYTEVEGLINFFEIDSSDVATATITGRIYRS
tara:strand:- start:51 stop:473 length:423 start_codon:yes stop_codon:yes gene_type:complete